MFNQMLSSLTDKVINAIGETHYKRWMSRGGEEYMLEFASEWCSRSQYLRACKEMYVCRNMLEKIAGHLNGASLPYDSNMLAVERMFKNYLAEQIVVKTCVTSFVDQYIDSEDFEVIEHLVKLGVLIVDDTEDLSEVSSLSSEPDASDDCSINISKPDAFDLICIETIEGEHFNSVCNLPLFPEDDNSFSNKIVDCSNLKPNPLLCIEEENENENRECVLFEKAVISFPPNKENNGSRIISFPFVVNEKCTPNIQILSSTPVYVMPQYVYDLFSSYIDTVFLDISTLFTKEFLDAGLDEKRMCRSLGEIFDLHRKDDLLLVGGVRGARGRRGGNRRGPKRRVNKKRGKRKGGRRRNVLGVIQPGRFMPDRFFATLRYDDQQYNRTLTAGVSNWFFQNSPYEPDPTSGTTNVVPGFTDLNAMYNRWKVHKIIMHYTLTCNNTDPIFFVTWPSNVAPSAGSLTKAQLTQYSSNAGGKRTLVGNTGGGVVRGRAVATGVKLWGRPFMFDDDYVGVGTTAPTLLFYLNCGIYDPVAAEALPLIADIRIELVTEFFQLKQLTD